VSDDVVARLRAAGLGTDEAARKADMFAAARAALESLPDGGASGSSPARSFWVPGRIEFLGKHTDYAGGRSLLCTVERGICLVARPRRDSRVRIRAVALCDMLETAFDAIETDSSGHWGTYPTTVMRRLARNFGGEALVGADIAFVSDLPIAAGMSSSSALVVAVFLALSAVNDLPARGSYRRAIQTDEDLAGYAGCMEGGMDFKELAGDRGVGTLSGSEDQTAMFCARPGSLVQYAFCPVRFERAIPLPDDYTFAVASSGVVAQKTAQAMPRYNALARKAHAIADVWRAAHGGAATTIGEILSEQPAAATEIPSLLSVSRHDEFGAAELIERFEQFYHESAVLIPAAGDRLARGDLTAVGALVDRSVSIGARLLGNQIPETLGLSRMARELGAAAASPFGAGWGGSVWALVGAPESAAFLASWQSQYAAAFPERAGHSEFFVTKAGAPAMQL